QHGVHVREILLDDSEPRKVWDPTHPYAKPEGHVDAGYVYKPNVDRVTETINGLEAQRAYEANVQAAEATKSMVAQALRLIA
ncbi:MAG: flagellar basal body rod C-terminal domain-containing protein, partial [Planctomycetota bacterium]